jgi:diaminohydroxyphosphoribosylaminopyrimidine deaminase/5-amino-6-(5-phosphoribosylamino)uracil reductase
MKDKDFLLQALHLAHRRKGFCAPNPSVGAVVVKNGEILGEGYHEAPGMPHAEVNAIKASGEAAAGAVVYVSLEPCCHVGRTPPCTDLLIASRVERVVYGYRDPNPKVAGGGEAALQKAGIPCELLALPEVSEFYKSYGFWTREHRPWVTLKIAASLDGKIAGEQGAPYRLTGDALKQWTHQHRQSHDALLTTVKTIIQDDPQLNVRLPSLTLAKPVYVLDRQAQLPLNAKVLGTASSVTVFHGTDVSAERLSALESVGVLTVLFPENKWGLDLSFVLDYLGAAGVQALWVEAGGRCFESFIAQGLAQEAYWCIAPVWLGETAYSAMRDSTPDTLFQGSKQISWHSVGEDAVLHIQW